MLPDKITHRADLSKNQLRAREIALNIGTILTTVPAGTRVISSDIKDKLGELYNTAHDQTVSRVMDFLDDLVERQPSIDEFLAPHATGNNPLPDTTGVQDREDTFSKTVSVGEVDITSWVNARSRLTDSVSLLVGYLYIHPI